MAKNPIIYHPPTMYHSSRWPVVILIMSLSVFVSFLGDVCLSQTILLPGTHWRLYGAYALIAGSLCFLATKISPKTVLGPYPKNPWQLPPVPGEEPLDMGMGMDMDYDLGADSQDIIEEDMPDARLDPLMAVLAPFPLVTIVNPTFQGDDPVSLAITSTSQGYISANYSKIIGKLKKEIDAKYSYTVKSYRGIKNNIIYIKKLDDWFAKPDKFLLRQPYPCENYRSVLGRTETGEKVYIPWENNNTLLIAGNSGSGKTASMLPIFAGFAGINELCIADGKAGGDWDPIRRLTVGYNPQREENFGYITSVSADALIPILERANRLRAYRVAFMRKVPAYPSSVWATPWNKSVRPSDPILSPLFIVIDECQVWLNMTGSTKAEKAAKIYTVELLKNLAATGRSAAIFVVYITQDPDAETMGKLRRLANMKISFRLNSSTTTNMILPNLGENDPKPHLIPETMPDGRTKIYGRCIFKTESSGFQEVQANYIPGDRYDQLLSHVLPIPDQLEEVKRLLTAHNIPFPHDEECGIKVPEEK